MHGLLHVEVTPDIDLDSIYVMCFRKNKKKKYNGSLKPQLHIHDFGHGRATTHPDLSSRDASA